MGRRRRAISAWRTSLSIGRLGAAAGLPVFGLTGVVVAYHQPRNPVGWILISFPFLFLLGVDAQYYTVLRYHLGHSGLPFGPAAVVVAPGSSPPCTCFRW